MAAAIPAAPQLCCDVPRLLLHFESLGENCDLGVAQRAAGVEPLGLFRFGGSDAAGVVALLRARLHPLCEPEDLWLDEVGENREYWVKSRQFPAFAVHTERFAGRDHAEITRRGQIEHLRYLKAHLLEELSRCRKLFVFKGPSDPATIGELAAALQDFGPNCLLWVNVAGDARAPGAVERAAPGLLLGFVSRFGTYDGPPSVPVEEWVTVCAGAYRLWRGEEPPRAPLDNLILRAIAAGACRWTADATARARTLPDPGFPSGAIFEHRLAAADREAVVCRARLPVAEGGDFTFSAWIRIPEEMQQPQIGLALPGLESLAAWSVDPKSRGRWQRAWAAARAPLEARAIACDLMAAGTEGRAFHSAGWCLERGTRPSGYGFAL